MPLDTGFSIATGQVVGQPIDRRDGRLKVTGRARYAAEFDIDNLAYAVLVQSAIASGEITGFDLSEAQAVPGVLTIMTPDNAPRLPPAAPGQSETTGPLVAKPLLQDRLIYYNGQHIALVVADTLERAQQAAALVDSSIGRPRRRSACRMRSAVPTRRSISATARGRLTAAAAIPKRPSPRRRSRST